MSNHNEYWGKKFGYIDGTLGRVLGFTGFGARPRTNKANPNRPQTKQSKLDKKRYEDYVKKFGRPVIYYNSNGTKNAEKTRINSPSIHATYA
jgi:hypothetical protein